MKALKKFQNLEVQLDNRIEQVLATIEIPAVIQCLFRISTLIEAKDTLLEVFLQKKGLEWTGIDKTSKETGVTIAQLNNNESTCAL